MEVNSFEAPEYIFNSINYVSYLVEYVGELNGTITNNPGIYIILSRV